MDFKKFNYKNEVCTFEEVIEDEKECKKLEKLLKDGKDLPEGIFYEQSAESEYITFYREYCDEEIKDQLEISRANSLHSIASSLKFFKILAIIAIVGCFIAGIVAVILYLNATQTIQNI